MPDTLLPPWCGHWLTCINLWHGTVLSGLVGKFNGTVSRDGFGFDDIPAGEGKSVTFFLQCSYKYSIYMCVLLFDSFRRRFR